VRYNFGRDLVRFINWFLENLERLSFNESLIGESDYEKVGEIIVEEKSEKAIKEYEEGNLNKALSIFKEIFDKDPQNEKALYYLSKIYRELKKWNLSKSFALKYLKFYGKNPIILEIIGDVNFFEGDYSRAQKNYSKALKLVKDNDLQEKIKNKLRNTTKKALEVESFTRIALIVAEGEDDFTDDIVEGLSGYFWIRKFTIPKKQSRIYSAFAIGLTKEFFSKGLYKFLVNIYPSNLKKALKWANVVWAEWATHVALATNYIKKKDKKLFIRLHRYEAFTDYPLFMNWENVDKVVFVSAFVKKVLEDRGIRIGTKKNEVIYNGVDLQRFEFRPRDNGFDIGWVANIIPQKNLHMALEIVRKLADEDKRYKLHIAGNFPDLMYERYIKHLIKAMKLESNVVLYGWVDDIAKWWDNKNYLLSTSIVEGHPYNILEAMARGIKPVIHNFDGAEELYEEEFLFNNIDEAVEKIRTGSYDSAYYREYLKNKKWTLENQVDEFKRLVEELTSRMLI